MAILCLFMFQLSKSCVMQSFRFCCCCVFFLLQEARKIIVAQHQRVAYYEFLPRVLGPDVMEIMGIDKPYRYNSQIDPSAINAFGAAAYRYRLQESLMLTSWLFEICFSVFHFFYFWSLRYYPLTPVGIYSPSRFCVW